LVVSDDVVKRAGVTLPAQAHHDVTVAGRTEPLTVFAIANAAEIQSLAVGHMQHA
jgi:hypothetical protein